MTPVCGATCTERPEKATGEILGHTAMKVGPCLLPSDHGDMHDPAPIFLGHLDGQRWQPPVVRCVCPSCGKIDDRTPSSWSFHGRLTLKARFGCAPLRDWAEDGCHRLFDLIVELPPSHRTTNPAPPAPTAHPAKIAFDLLRDRIAQAVYDPGAVVGPRVGPSWGPAHEAYADEQESLWDWQIRAVLRVVRTDGPRADELDPPQVEVMGEDLVHLINPHGALLCALNYEQLLVLQERVEDAVATMALMPSTTPSTVKRPRKERRDGNAH